METGRYGFETSRCQERQSGDLNEPRRRAPSLTQKHRPHNICGASGCFPACQGEYRLEDISRKADTFILGNIREGALGLGGKTLNFGAVQAGFRVSSEYVCQEN